VVLQFCIKQKP